MEARKIREEKGLTAKYVAEQLGITPRTLNKKERENSFTTLQLRELCRLYGVKIDDVDI